MTGTHVAEAQLKAAAALRDRMEDMIEGRLFASPALRVYNPLSYAWRAFEEYVVRYGGAKKRALFLGMNPGPWGMAQTGVPFGEVSLVRNWLGISAPIGRPDGEHPKYPVDGYGCKRSEVSGKRLWGLFRDRFGTAEAFFEDHFVANYCPLLFLETSKLKDGREGARNLTPDKLPTSVRSALFEACDAHLRVLVDILSPRWLIGVGNFAAGALAKAVESSGTGALIVEKILHPSPASPRSNADWAGEVTRRLTTLGVWRTVV